MVIGPWSSSRNRTPSLTSYLLCEPRIRAPAPHGTWAHPSHPHGQGQSPSPGARAHAPQAGSLGPSVTLVTHPATRGPPRDSKPRLLTCWLPAFIHADKLCPPLQEPLSGAVWHRRAPVEFLMRQLRSAPLLAAPHGAVGRGDLGAGGAQRRGGVGTGGGSAPMCRRCRQAGSGQRGARLHVHQVSPGPVRTSLLLPAPPRTVALCPSWASPLA